MEEGIGLLGRGQALFRVSGACVEQQCHRKNSVRPPTSPLENYSPSRLVALDVTESRTDQRPFRVS